MQLSLCYGTIQLSSELRAEAMAVERRWEVIHYAQPWLLHHERFPRSEESKR